jgi:hypothetical protein
MCIFNKKRETGKNNISLIINKLKFFDMSKIKKSCPASQRNGVKNGLFVHYQLIT